MRAAIRACVVVVSIFAFLLPVLGQSNAMQVQILNASINLGWVAGVIEYQGKTWENIDYLTARMSDAGASVTEIGNLLAPPYTGIDLSSILDRIINWDSRTSSMNTSAMVGFISNIYESLRQTMSIFFDARTQTLVWDVTCDSQYAVVGFYFGQANIAAIMEDGPRLSSHISTMRQAIQVGLTQNSLKLCGFGYEPDWDALTIFSGDTSSTSFDTSRQRMIDIIWRTLQSDNLVQDGTFSTFGSLSGPWGQGEWGEYGIWWNSGSAASTAEIVSLTADDYMYMQYGITTALLITNPSPRGGNVFGTTVQRIQATPYQTYAISLWAASRDTPNNNAVSIAVETEWAERPIVLQGGSYGWTRYEGTFRTDESGIIQLRILTEDICTVWLTGILISPSY